MSTTYIVGAVHWDLKGPYRLRKFLDTVQPTVVGLEATQAMVDAYFKSRLFQLSQRKGDFNELYNMLNNSNIESLSKMNDSLMDYFVGIQGYESWTSVEYMLANHRLGVKIEPLHCQEVIQKNLTKLRECSFSTTANGPFTGNFEKDLEKMSISEFQKLMDKEYDPEYICEILKNPTVLEIVREFDDVMINNSKKLLSKHIGDTVIVMGMNHAFGLYENNFSDRLSDYGVVKVKLEDVDSLC